jgi:hypothetical protein
MSIRDEYIARGADWVSRSGGATISPRGYVYVEPPPPPPPSTGGSHFLYTSAQVTQFQSRMSGAGPFYSSGQGFNGPQANAPGDGVRALNHANNFIASPLSSRWAIPVPMVSGNNWPGGSGSGISINQAISPMRAAWCAMTLPGHANASSWRSETKAWILWNVNHANHNFANSSWYPVNYAGFAPSPIFAYGGWMNRIIKARDMLGRDAFTTAENAAFDNWIYRWANFMMHWFHLESIKGKVPGRLSGNYAPSGSWVSTLTDYLAYTGSVYVSEAAAFGHTNRHAACVASASFAANYLKYYGVTPTTSGTQPSYGWYTVDDLLIHSKAYAAEFVYHSTYPQGFTGDFHRAYNATSSTNGWTYAANEIVGPVSMAKYHALRGDDSLWSYSTTSGSANAGGVPNNTSTVTGFPEKNIRYAQWSHCRYVSNSWSPARDVRGLSLVPSNPYRDVLNAAKVHKRYPTDAILQSAWQRSGNGFPGYTSSVESQGAFSGWDGEMASSIGLIEEGGV